MLINILAIKLINYIFTRNESNTILSNNINPNIFKIYKDKDKKYIEISKIREIIHFQNRSSFNNKIRCVIIDDLEYLSINSSNALLKSLEEPNENFLFILIHNSESSVLDTIKSRCIEFKTNLKINEIKKIVDNYFNDEIYINISNDFRNYYNSPSFLILLIEFFKENSLDYINITIDDFINYLIKNKYYLNNQFIIEHLNVFVELFFYKNINNSKIISYKIKEYFYLKLAQIRKYNLDLETFFIEFEEKLLSE